MNRNESSGTRSGMFKHKSGGHILNSIVEEKEDRKRIRHEDRHRIYLKNRIKAADNNDILDDCLESIPQKLGQNRQQLFQEKFKKYLHKKATSKKSNVKPFVSAVPKGRFIDTTKEKHRENQKKSIKKLQCETPKPSQIITRSKKVEKDRLNEIVVKQRASINAKQTVIGRYNTNKAFKIDVLKLSPPKRPPSTFSRVQHAIGKSKKGEQMSEPKNKDIKKVSTKSFKTFVTSTVAKQKTIRSLSNQPKKLSAVFDESISPIESGFSTHKSPDSQKGDSEQGHLNYVSPFVTISRGSRNSHRIEKSARNSKYTLESRKSFDLNRSLEQRQNFEAASYFRIQVHRETERLKHLINSWQEYADKNVNNISSEAIDQINVAMGQTNLLITNKFKQFSSLIDQCSDTESNDVKVKPEDLEGFWSMVYLQIENCNQRFERLKTLKSNNWEDFCDGNTVNITKQKKLQPKNSMVTKNKPSHKCNSALAKILKQARENYKNSNKNSGTQFIDNSTVKKLQTSQKGWMIENSLTPARSILRTPNSVSKKSMRLKFKSSPQIKMFVEEN